MQDPFKSIPDPLEATRAYLCYVLMLTFGFVPTVEAFEYEGKQMEFVMDGSDAERRWLMGSDASNLRGMKALLKVFAGRRGYKASLYIRFSNEKDTR